MQFQLGAMSVGDILDRGLKLLWARLPTFYVINLFVLLPLIVLEILLPQLVVGQEAIRQLITVAVGFFLVLLSGVFLTPLGSAAILHVIAQEFVGRRVGVGEAAAFALKRFWGLFLGSLLYAVILVPGCCACVIPGVFFFVLFAFFAQIIVVEGLGPFAAFQRSQALTRGFRWRLLGLVVLLFVIQGGSFVVSGTLALYLPGLRPVYRFTPEFGLDHYELYSYTNHILTTLATRLLDTLTQAYTSICLTLFYFDLRIRKEGYDLEVAARQHLSDEP